MRISNWWNKVRAKENEVCIHRNDKSYSMSTPKKEHIETRQLSISDVTRPFKGALGDRIWDTEEIFWKRESDYEFLTNKQLDAMEKLAFLQASLETKLVINKKNKSTADAQIVINWLGAKDEPYFRTNNPNLPVSSILAYAWGPGRGLGGDVVMNADQLWLFRKTPLTVKDAFDMGYIQNYDRNHPENKIRYYDPQHTFTHEATGHGLGMPHITNIDVRNTEIMYPYYNGLRRFGPSELLVLHSYYGDAKVNPDIKEELLGRVETTL